MTVQEMLETTQGYERYYNRVDADIVDEIDRCEECGVVHCTYFGFKKGDSYRAFMVCPNGHALEF